MTIKITENLAASDQPARYCVQDTETTGLDEQRHALLTGCHILLTADLTEIVRIQYTKFFDDSRYEVSPGSKMNGISLVEHNKVASLTPDIEEAIIQRLFKTVPATQKLRYKPTGQAPWFDTRFLKAQLPGVPWDDYFDYHMVDTDSITEGLVIGGVYPPDRSTSLAPTAEFFGFDASRAHTEDGDNEMVIQLLKMYQGRLRLSDKAWPVIW